MTEKHVSDEDYGRRYGSLQVPHEYIERVRDEFPECKFFQAVNVGSFIYIIILTELLNDN